MCWLTNPRLFPSGGFSRVSLSLLLFILVEEALSPSLGRIVQGDFMEEIRVGSAADGHLSVFHMFFADDKHLFVG